jgi:hypothetical protein
VATPLRRNTLGAWDWSFEHDGDEYFLAFVPEAGHVALYTPSDDPDYPYLLRDQRRVEPGESAEAVAEALYEETTHQE